MDKDSKFTRDDNGNIAVRVFAGGGVAENPDYMFTRDDDGNIAVRVVFGEGSGGGGDSSNLGYFATLEALQEAYPTAEPGNWAIVGTTDTVWVWDEDTTAWVDTDQKGQVTSVNNQTGAVTLGINDVAPSQTGKSGYVLGTDGFVAGWIKLEQIQRSALPQASEDEVDKIYQYVGATDANYTNGYFYKCVSDGGNPATYSWENIEVQEADSLPTQTGNAGKFLTTNGTDASWSDKALVNNATGSNSLSILGNAISASRGTAVGKDSYVSNIGGTSCGYLAKATGIGTIALGVYAVASGLNSIQLGSTGSVTTNSDANTFKVANANGNFEIMSADGTIPTARLTKVNTTITLVAANWSSNQQTVNVTGVTATNIAIVAPAPTSASDYSAAEILCTAQGTDSLTFTCVTTPTNDISVNVVIL